MPRKPAFFRPEGSCCRNTERRMANCRRAMRCVLMGSAQKRMSGQPFRPSTGLGAFLTNALLMKAVPNFRERRLIKSNCVKPPVLAAALERIINGMND
jgi:hypothetical protein